MSVSFDIVSMGEVEVSNMLDSSSLVAGDEVPMPIESVDASMKNREFLFCPSILKSASSPCSLNMALPPAARYMSAAAIVVPPMTRSSAPDESEG